MPSPAHPDAAVLDLIARSDGILLDFNGTLSDDEDLLAELVDVVADSELGVSLSRKRYFEEFAGFTEEYMFGILAKEAGVTEPSPHDLLQVFNALYIERTRENSTISEQAAEFVRQASAQGRALAVVTAASRDVVVPALENAGLLRFLADVIALEDVAAPKPDPEGYTTALKRLGLDAARTVVFEDSRTGITAAAAAGIETVAVLGSLSEEELDNLTPYRVPELSPALLG